MLWARMLADLIVVFHAAYVSFVVFGLAADPARSRASLELGPQPLVPRDPSDRDRDRGRRGARRIPCPLTVWEEQLRKMAGQTGYTGDFLGYWAHQLIFYRAEPWVFTVIYTPVRPGGPGCVHPGSSSPAGVVNRDVATSGAIDTETSRSIG